MTLLTIIVSERGIKVKSHPRRISDAGLQSRLTEHLSLPLGLLNQAVLEFQERESKRIAPEQQ